jgi:hypothetical protein
MCQVWIILQLIISLRESWVQYIGTGGHSPHPIDALATVGLCQTRDRENEHDEVASWGGGQFHSTVYCRTMGLNCMWMKSRAGIISFFVTHGCRGTGANIERTCTQKCYAKCKWRTRSICLQIRRRFKRWLWHVNKTDLAHDEQVSLASCRQDTYLNSGND